MHDLHVVSDERTTWKLYENEHPVALSEHTTASEATREARARAQQRGAQRVVVHDRYHRTHDADPVTTASGDGAHRACAHQPDAAGHPAAG